MLGRTQIRLIDVYAKQVELAEQVRALREQLTPDVADHEVRIRGLERWRYSLPLAAVGSIASAVLALASWLH
jgi:hypothetical protein